MSINVAAVMIVRNEQYLLPLTIAHLLHELGIDRLFIADHGSTDRTPAILAHVAAADERIRWTLMPGPYRQPEILTGLALDAHRAGAAWVLPTDADEFLWLRNDRLRDRLVGSDAGVLELTVRNFVQWSYVRRNHPRAMETMVFSAKPVGTVGEAADLVERGDISFVEITYPPKQILRAASSMVIHRGNHYATGIDGGRAPLLNAELLHAPIRARDGLEQRAEMGQRFEQEGATGRNSWHVRRLVQIADEGRLDAEWDANSTWTGTIGPANRRRRLKLDFRLRRIARRHRAFARDLLEASRDPAVR